MSEIVMSEIEALGGAANELLKGLPNGLLKGLPNGLINEAKELLINVIDKHYNKTHMNPICMEESK